MNNIKHSSNASFFGSKTYIILAAMISVPIWIVINAYVRSIQVGEDEAVSTATTVFFILGIFSGRYASHILVSAKTRYPLNLIFGLSAAATACIAWLFFHADFPLNGRVFINLMLFWLPLLALSVIIGMLVKVVHSVTQNQLSEAQKEAAQRKSELGLLQSQLSPHFLFNTLNNLYGIAITDHQKMPALLLKLSELLRYSVYDAGEVYVPLKNELDYIRNYIEFEKIRLEDRLVLTTDIEDIIDTNIKIAPMLLIVFIENAFKHSRNTASPEIFVDISIRTWGSSLLFSVRNSYGKEKEENSMLSKSGGMGLPNVTKRLELLYPGTHELNVRSDERFYTVELQLKINQ